MYKTIEDEIRKKTAPAAFRSEFTQHEFERQHTFCLRIYIASVAMWVVFDLILSTIGGQPSLWLSLLFIGVFSILTVALRYTRKAGYFDVLNLFFVFAITLGGRLLVEDLPDSYRGAWLIIAAATTLYSASFLPLSRWSFYGAQLITWTNLNPFYRTDVGLFELMGAMTLCYSTFICALTLFSFFKLREAKLYNYIMAKLLLDQAYVDTLTEIPNRRAFMTRADQQLHAASRAHDHYLAMIDIDNFKKVNDAYGHDVGDEVLKRIAADIRTVMVDFEFARLGGEEFAVYMTGIRREDVEYLAGELCRVVRVHPTRYPVTISIGLARVADNDTLNQALIKADEALYESKHSGKDRYTFHDYLES